MATMGKYSHNTGSKGVPMPKRMAGGMQQPGGHGNKVSTGHKMTMVGSKGATTTGAGATGASNHGVTKAGVTGQPSGVGTRKRMA